MLYQKYISNNIANILKLQKNITHKIKKKMCLQASVHLNSIAADNKTLREHLDHLLQERAQFNTRYEKLAEKLADGRKLAGELTDAATQAYDQRWHIFKLLFKFNINL